MYYCIIIKTVTSTPIVSVPPEKVNESLWWKLKSPKTNALADGSIKRASSMLDKTASKTVAKEEDSDR